MRMTVDFLKVNRNVWLAVFTGMTQAQVTLALNTLSTDFPEITRTVTEQTASSISNYQIVQLDRDGYPIPAGIKDIVRKAVNNVYSGVLS